MRGVEEEREDGGWKKEKEGRERHYLCKSVLVLGVI